MGALFHGPDFPPSLMGSELVKENKPELMQHSLTGDSSKDSKGGLQSRGTSVLRVSGKGNQAESRGQ